MRFISEHSAIFGAMVVSALFLLGFFVGVVL